MRKARLQEIIENLPDDVRLDKLIERLKIFHKLELSEQAVARGEVFQHSEVVKHFSRWLK